MRYIKTYKIFESVNKLSDIPSEDDIKDFFYDLLDELPYIKVFGFYNSGYAAFSNTFLYGPDDVKDRLLDDMLSVDDWINKYDFALRRRWSDIFLPINRISRNCYPVTTHERLVDESEFERELYKNITNGTIPSCPFIELTRIYFDANDRDKLNKLYDSLRRVYESTGFRPVGNFHTEDFVDEDSGELVNLYVANIQLFKCTDLEYKSLIRSSIVNLPDNDQNKEMTKKFL